MKLSKKILTEKDVKDILAASGFRHIEKNLYWSEDYEYNTEVVIGGKTLADLIIWLCKFFAHNAESYGKSCGKSEFIYEIKKLFRF